MLGTDIILLAKSNNLTDCADFRPIAITGVIGKIIFSVLSDNLQKYMLQNAYIDREVQKGFLTGISGCLEHSFALHEALKEAKSWKKSIVVTWIDLANAYGSVRHNLIQFALELRSQLCLQLSCEVLVGLLLFLNLPL